MLISLQRALNLSSEAIVVYEPLRDAAGALTDMRIWMVNDAAVSVFGIARAAAEGQLLSEIWPIEYDSPSWTLRSEVLDGGEPRTFEWFTEAMGEPHWFVVDYRRFEDKLAASYRDVTAFKQATAEAEAQKAFYEELVRQSTTRKAILSPVFDEAGAITDFRYEYANYGKGIDDAHRKLAYFDVDIAGKLVTELIPSVKRTPVFDFYKEVYTGGRPMRTELWHHADGINSAVVLTGLRLDGERILVTYNDISDAHRLAMDLEKERARLDAVFENVPLGMTVFEAVRDTNGVLADLRLTRRNEQALRLSRIPAEKYQVGTLLSELMPEDMHEAIELMLNVVRTGEPFVHELYQPHLDIWIQSRVMKHGDGLLNTIQDITQSKRQNEALTGQKALLEGVMEASPNGITVLQALRDASGAVTDFRVALANEKIVGASGHAREDYFGKPFFERRPELRSEVMPVMLRVLETRRPEATETLVPDIARWMRTSFTPLGDGLVATIEDITGQKEIVARIERSAGLLNAVLDASPISVVVYESIRDAAGTVADFRPLIANKLAIELSGRSPEDFLKLSFFQHSGELPETVLPALQAVVAQQQTQVFEHQSVGKKCWLRSVITPFGDGFIVTSQDISAHKQQTAQIEEQAALFNGILASLQNGLSIYRIIRDGDGALEDLEYLEVADTVLRDTGKSRDEILGHRILALYPGLETTDYWRAYTEVAETGRPVSFETHFTLPGYDNYLLNWVTPIGHDRLVSVYYKINDLKQAQRELEHTVHELRRSNEDLEQFASIASHDLQEPLRKVQSFGAMLESRYAEALGEGGKDLVVRMQKAAGRMRNLVTGLLAFSRLSGDQSEALRPIDLNALIADICTDLEEQLQGSGGHISVASRLPFVMGIEGQLRHLFQNVLSNALKFRKPDLRPEVRISAGPPAAGDAGRLSPLANPADYVRVEMADNGIGFEPEFAEKIFGLFERLHGVNEYQGTGIGLSISRRVAERHGGAIWATGEKGVGSTFFVLLQLAR